jgi:UDP-glucose 6-dehydrogenase
MKITIVGFGYIGAVIGATFSKMGHKVVAIDSNEKVINDLNLGKSNIPEPQLN